jgi:uncharacterized protein (TIGR00369 family)
MTRRDGPFWDGVEGRAPLPAAARTLGFEFISADPDGGHIEVAFSAPESFTNPMGNVLGAFLAAMLYDTVGPALLATLGPDQFQSTSEIRVRFLRPTRPGRILGHGHVVDRTDIAAQLEATLTNPQGDPLATATAVAKIIALSDAPQAV